MHDREQLYARQALLYALACIGHVGHLQGPPPRQATYHNNPALVKDLITLTVELTNLERVITL